jgi:hypothetical protein
VANPPTLPIPAVDTTSCRGLLSQARAGRQPVCRPLLRTGGAVPPCPPAARLGRPFVHAGRRPRPWASPPIPVGFNRRPSVRGGGASPRRTGGKPDRGSPGGEGNRVRSCRSLYSTHHRGRSGHRGAQRHPRHIKQGPSATSPLHPRRMTRAGLSRVIGFSPGIYARAASPARFGEPPRVCGSKPLQARFWSWVFRSSFPSTLNPQPTSLNPQPTSLNPQPSTLDHPGSLPSERPGLAAILDDRTPRCGRSRDPQ